MLPVGSALISITRCSSSLLLLTNTSESAQLSVATAATIYICVSQRKTSTEIFLFFFLIGFIKQMRSGTPHKPLNEKINKRKMHTLPHRYFPLYLLLSPRCVRCLNRLMKSLFKVVWKACRNSSLVNDLFDKGSKQTLTAHQTSDL